MARLVSGKQIDHNTLEVGSRVEVLGGTIVEVQEVSIEQEECKGCHFYGGGGYGTGICKMWLSDREVCRYCAPQYRSDHKSVIFKAV